MREDALPTLSWVSLFVSPDKGKSWREADRKVNPPRGDQSFEFVAPEDGVYWFAIQVRHTDGRLDPPDVRFPGSKVLVRTEKAGTRQEQAEHLLCQALGEKSDAAGLALKILLQSKGTFVATDRLTFEKDGRARLEPFRAVLFGKGGDFEATVLSSDGAVITLEKPVRRMEDLGDAKVVEIQFIGRAEMKKVSLDIQPLK